MSRKKPGNEFVASLPKVAPIGKMCQGFIESD
jgi:hypothetical protein